MRRGRGAGAGRVAGRGAWAVQLPVGLCLMAWGWGVSLFDLAPLSRWWFQPLWLGWALTADAIVLAREGRSMLHAWPRRWLLLLVLSVVFWWPFEWLNWHTRNWSYTGHGDFSQLLRVVYATLAFSTVIPALAEARDLLRSLTRSWRRDRREARRAVPTARPPDARSGRWLIGAAVLAGVALWLFPRQAFPLVWVAPLLALEGLTVWAGRPSAVTLARAGRWAPVLLVALAGLGTGVLWELWNWGADPHWEYQIPYVGFWRVFEMPLLGYLGYLPFALSADAFVRLVMWSRGGLSDGPVTELAPVSGKAVRQAHLVAD